MNRNKYIIFEYFSLRSFSIFFLTQIKSIPEFTNYSFIYIDSSPFFKYLAKSKLISLLPINLSRLNFRLIDLKDENRELIRLRIFRKDLYQLKSNILSNKDYKKILSNNDQTLYDFQLKGILGGHIMAPDSMARTIFLINLVKYRFSQHLKDTKLILNYRPWINSITKYSEDQKVNTTTITSFFEIKKKLKKYIHSIKYYNSSLYLLLRSFKYATFNPFRESRRYYKNQLLFEGRGDVRFINDGYHSDFFWLMNSEFKDEGLTYISTNNEEIEKLDKNSVNLARFSLNLNPLEYLKKTYKLKYIKQYSNESRSINNFTREYCSNYKYWKQLLKTNNIKILMNWHLFDRFNYPQNQALKDLGGISVYLPISFSGFRSIQTMSNFDISFCISKFNAQLETYSECKTKYQVITGYPRDYSLKLLESEANSLRLKLMERGSKNIVCVLDENSNSDNRWHTGHELQRENYKYILLEVLRNSELGVIFKPKTSKTLNQRMGDEIVSLLNKAESTGRCFVFRRSGRHTTLAPPALAALASDVTIGCHMDSSTAALEAALGGIKTILIDREGQPNSILAQKLSAGKVIYDSWEEALAATINYFQNPSENSEFGDWSNCIDELDPFRDGLAAKRIGDFLQSLREGFNQGLQRDEVMQRAYENYANRWGKDMIIKNIT